MHSLLTIIRYFSATSNTNLCLNTTKACLYCALQAYMNDLQQENCLYNNE